VKVTPNRHRSKQGRLGSAVRFITSYRAYICGKVCACPEICFPGGVGTEAEEARPMHYHIRWSSGKLDWERYATRVEAEAGARKLMRQEQTYVVEEFSNTGCPRCREG
jgi:hypothetical protein